MSAKDFMILDLPVRAYECGPDGRMRAHILFDYLQHIAAVHAESLGFGMTAIREKGLLWILSRIRLHMDEYPLWDETVRVETYHNGEEKIFAKRQFTLHSVRTGRRFGYASSFWLCLELPDFKTRRPGEVLDLTGKVNFEREDFFPELGKLPRVESFEPVTHRISASHIDLNDHLNNTYYCEYALDWLARQTGKIERFREIQINFNRAMKLGEELSVAGKIDGDAFQVAGTAVADGKNSFQASGFLADAVNAGVLV